MSRRRTLWVPALLSSLALLTVVGGVAVGHFYWTSLRGSMDRMETSMSEARERQQVLVEQIDRTRDLLGEEGRRLRREADALHEREAAMAEQRRLLAREREALERALAERRALAEQEARVAERLAAERLRLHEAARLATSAARRVGEDRGVAAASLAAAGALLRDLERPGAEALRHRLAALEARVAPPDARALAALEERLEAALARTGRLPALGNARAWASRAPRRPGEPAGTPARGVLLQLQAARFALERGDWRLYQEALENAGLWLERFFDERRAETVELQRDVEALRAGGREGDTGILQAELSRLAEELAAAADPPAAGPEASAPAAQDRADLRGPAAGLSSD